METPTETIERLKSEWRQLIFATRLEHRGDRYHFEDSLADILSAHKELLVTAREIAEENEILKSLTSLESAIAAKRKRLG